MINNNVFFYQFKGSIFKIPRVRTFFNIPQMVAHQTPAAPKKKQTVVQNVKGGKNF